MSTTYTFWHGSRRWEGEPRIQGPKKGRGELGPGIYVTTHFETAAQYAKGGGAVRKIVMTPRLILQDAALSLSDAMEFVTDVVVKSKQGAALQRLMNRANKVQLDRRVLLGTDTEHVFAEMLVNMCINDDLALGAKGQALAEFLTAQGIDCSIERARGRDEYWGVIFNPKIIQSYEKFRTADVSLDLYELPSPEKQREMALSSAEFRKSSRILMPEFPCM